MMLTVLLGAVVVFLLALGVCCYRSHGEAVSKLLDSVESKNLSKLFFILIPIFLLLIGLRVYLEQRDYLSSFQGAVIMSFLSVVILAGLAWKIIRGISSTETNLAKAKADGESFFKQSLGLFAIIDFAGNFIQINAAFTETLGFTRQEFLSRPYLDFVHPDDKEKSKENQEALIRGEAILGSENRFRCKDGSWKVFLWRSFPVIEEELIYALALDITELRASESALQETHQKTATDRQMLLAVLNTVADAVISIDQFGKIQTFNPAAERLFGYSEEELIGQNVNKLMPAPHSALHDSYIKNYVAGGKPKVIGLTRELEGLRRDGSLFPMSLNVGELKGEGLTGFAGIIGDLTERNKIIAELKASRKQAEAASRAKSEFLANMSHEIRTPMNGVIGMMEVLQQTSLQGFQVEMVEVVQESANALLVIINNILDLSKIEAGKLELSEEPANLLNIFEFVRDLLARAAAKSNVELWVFVDPCIPQALLLDSVRLRQILINLVNNAVKFSSKSSHAGNVTIRATLSSQSTDQATLKISVKDNGIGMDKATVARIFSAFEQANSSTSSRYGGTGLGLAITQHLVTLMGGSIGVESAPEQGSTFEVEFTLPIAAPDSVQLPTFFDISGLLCLLVGPANGLGRDLEAYLIHAGAKVQYFENLAEVGSWLKLTKPSGRLVTIIDVEEKHPDLNYIVAEMGVPADLDLKLSVILIERGGRRIPRKLNANSFILDANVLHRNDFFDVVAAAAEREYLPLHRYVGINPKLQHSPDLVSPTREEAMSRGRLILVVEDNETNQKVLLQQLALVGETADMVDNGQEALERFREESYAMILTDLHMPVMDGYELTAAIRAEQGDNVRVPIVAFTANALSGEREHCIEAGMDDYLTKPAGIEKIREMLNKWLPVESSENETEEIVESPMAPMDLSYLKELFGNDSAAIQGLLQIFSNDLEKFKKEIRQLLDSGNTDALGAEAHKLKSSARSTGADELAKVFENIENAVRNGEREKIGGLLQSFDTAVQSVSEFLRDYLAPGNQNDRS